MQPDSKIQAACLRLRQQLMNPFAVQRYLDITASRAVNIEKKWSAMSKKHSK